MPIDIPSFLLDHGNPILRWRTAMDLIPDGIDIDRETLQTDLARLKTASIPLDIVYEQGVDVLGLTN